MVIKGSARGAPGELALHLLRTDTNETVRVLELSGVAADTLPSALHELDGMGAGSRSRRTLYHASINTPVSEQLTPAAQAWARTKLAAELGLAGQPYAMVEHVKHGRQHTHIVWSRIDFETGRAIPDSHNYRKHELVSRALEIDFRHQPVQGVHLRNKDTEPRPERGPTWAEQRQAERSGMTPAEAKRIVTECWQQTSTGAGFRVRLEAEGFTLAQGDRRDFVLIDRAGEVHSLARRIDGVKAAQVRERMGQPDGTLPTVAQVRESRNVSPPPCPEIEQRAVPASHETEPAVRTGPAPVEKPVPSTPAEIVKPLQQKPEPVLPIADGGKAPAVQETKAIRRPSAYLFVRIFGWIVDAYQRAFDHAKQNQREELKQPKQEQTVKPPPPPVSNVPKRPVKLGTALPRRKHGRKLSL